MSDLVKVSLTALALILTISLLNPAMALKPAEKVSPPNMDPGHPYHGVVTGRIMTGDTNPGEPGIYVAIVNAANMTQAFYEGQTDENGFYLFPSVNNTMAEGSQRLLFQVYAISGTSEGFSDPFGVGENSTAKVNVTIASSSQAGSGFVVEHIPMPDNIKLSAQPDTIVAGGNESIITAQLYYNGKPYARSGVTVTFFTDEEITGYLPTVKNSVSDQNGQSTINLTSGNATGDVNVTGFSMIGISRNLTGTCLMHVVSPSPYGVNTTNSTGILNAIEDRQTNTTDENVMVENSSAKPGLATMSATPMPQNSTPVSGIDGSLAIYTVLAIAVMAVAGLAVYFLVFRKN